MKRISVMFCVYGTLFLFFVEAFLPSLFFTDFFVDVYAKEEYRPRQYKYYTSLEIQSGDTLWSIASRYADEAYISVEDYIKEIKVINHLPSDMIIEGHYLTVFYYSEHYK